MTTPLLMFGQVNPFGIPVSVHAGKFYGTSPRDHVCGGLNYDVLEYTCCEGVRHNGARLSCCGNRAFNLTQASCCEGRLTLNVSQLVSDCCGFRAYDPLNQLCCDSRILNRTHPHAKCCGKECYNEDHQLCCGNVVEGRKVLTKMSSHHRCCGDRQFDQQSHCCCSEPLSPEPHNASCCASSSNLRGIDASSPNWCLQWCKLWLSGLQSRHEDLDRAPVGRGCSILKANVLEGCLI
ncbi:galaxin-like [Salmo trutta]|uniref:galaxin-like n=1 Tax=Salmo trutta TaxID=8032 RepID=UPI00113226E9|nr:galaxin-like [Salmo trutta]